MAMLDYKLLESFYFVIREGGFEKAALALCITQSAVSQRVKLLEEHAGQILLLRSIPPQATEPGKLYVNHYLNVNNLENNLEYQKGKNNEIIKLGINADSLATWFMPMAQKLLHSKMLLELKVEDQRKTIDYLKNGEVIACISTFDKPIQGCSFKNIGTMTYRLMSSCSFKDKWFKTGFNLENIMVAPAVLYNKNDNLHSNQLKKIFSITPNYLRHYIPSVEQFFNVVKNGLGYGLIPDIQLKNAGNQNQLVNLCPEYSQKVELYIHCWNYTSKTIKYFLDNIIEKVTKEEIIY